MTRRSNSPLNPEQAVAARHPSRLLQVIAAPGTGKTRVAAHRFGLHRFGARDARAVIAVSFTRAAAAELRARVASRWGSGALSWPHQVTTVDDFYQSLTTDLLLRGLVQWDRPLGPLTVLDSWTGKPGWGKQPASRQAWVPALVNGRITAVASTSSDGKSHEGFDSPAAVMEQLDAGICTHGDIRTVLRGALAMDPYRQALSDHLSATVKAVLIDEVYDGNHDEAEMIGLLAETTAAVTLIGDPWQALYGFRGAKPAAIDAAAKENGYTLVYLDQSHRFAPAIGAVVRRLREGAGIDLRPCGRPEPDIVLSRRWATLVNAGQHVVPLAFGQPKSPRDAATLFLLDRLVQELTGQSACYLDDAAQVLGLDRQAAHTLSGRLSGCLDSAAAGIERAKDAAALLRAVLEQLGCAERHPEISTSEAKGTTLTRLQLIASIRRDGTRRIVPGMSIHQAKGQEWNRVALCMTQAEASRLTIGLDSQREDDRVFYVALTRARSDVTVGVVRRGDEPEWHTVEVCGEDSRPREPGSWLG
jgi:DNA helicase II / ATP-dependent DNA helicase PcrA